MKPYPAYKDSGVEWIGEVPVDWRVFNLKRITQFIYGSSLPKEKRDKGQIPVYGSNGVVGFHTEAITKSPCILIGRKGSFGKINYSNVPCFPIDTTYFVDGTATKNDLRWLYYLLLILRLDSVSKDSAVPGLSREDAYEKRVPLPSLLEQKAIADFLDDKTAKIDTLIEKKQRQIELLEEQRTALINQAVTKGLDPAVPMKDSGIAWLGGIPEHWEIKPLKYITRLKSGDNITSLDIQERGLYTVYGGNGTRGYFSKFTHEGEFVLIGRQGALCGNINYAKDRFWASEHAVVATPLQEYKLMWFGELLRSMNLNQYSVSAAQPGLSVERIANLRIPVPPFIEQEAIEKFIRIKSKDINQQIELTQHQIELLKEYRTALIAAAVTGKIDVREKTDEY